MNHDFIRKPSGTSLSFVLQVNLLNVGQLINLTHVNKQVYSAVLDSFSERRGRSVCTLIAYVQSGFCCVAYILSLIFVNQTANNANN